MNGVEFSDRGKISDLPPTVGGKSLIFPRSEKFTLKKSGLKLPNIRLSHTIATHQGNYFKF